MSCAIFRSLLVLSLTFGACSAAVPTHQLPRIPTAHTDTLTVVVYTYPGAIGTAGSVDEDALWRAATAEDLTIDVIVADTRQDIRNSADLKNAATGQMLLLTTVRQSDPAVPFDAYLRGFVTGADEDAHTDVSAVVDLDQCALVELVGGTKENVLVLVSGPDDLTGCYARGLAYIDRIHRTHTWML